MTDGARLARPAVTRLDGVTGRRRPASPRGRRPARAGPGPGGASPGACGRCWPPTGLPDRGVGRARVGVRRHRAARRSPPGPGRLRRVRAEVAAAPPRLLDWMSTQVVEHPAVVYDVAGVEELAARQTKSIADRGRGPAAGPGGRGRRLHPGGRPVPGPGHRRGGGPGGGRRPRACATGTTPGPTWCAGSTHLGLAADVAEVRRLTNAALMSKGDGRGRADARPLHRAPAGPAVGRATALVDALPFGSSLGRASVKAAEPDRPHRPRPRCWPVLRAGGPTAPARCGPRPAVRLRGPWPGTSGCARAAGR